MVDRRSYSYYSLYIYPTSPYSPPRLLARFPLFPSLSLPSLLLRQSLLRLRLLFRLSRIEHFNHTQHLLPLLPPLILTVLVLKKRTQRADSHCPVGRLWRRQPHDPSKQTDRRTTPDTRQEALLRARRLVDLEEVRRLDCLHHIGETRWSGLGRGGCCWCR